MNSAIETALTIAADHPAFAGHFPGDPIVPGVVLLDEALRVIDAATGIAHCGVAWVKFLRPVRPGASLLVRHAVEAGGAVGFEILLGADTICTGRLDPPTAA